ncbi:SRPBCC family protein [Nocardia sp. alder85J]|uniref:SRPBCC family protein n=1 Tax=Nocardia sp. alder85J TaxID=2862949 RepID=UPI001CD5F3E3|nr:SRPBCC family protein [Nocardia sp. alder85J]MCX4091588.1 SRPBCC family protein [Nocardia sp. alder85J]
MASTTIDTVVPAPRDVVYQLFAVRDSLNAHLPITFTLREPGSGEPNGVGAVYAVGRAGVTIIEETTQLVPGERMEYKVVRGGVVKNHLGTITFADAPDGTLVSYTMRADLKIPAPDRLTVALLRSMINPFLVAARKAVAN